MICIEITAPGGPEVLKAGRTPRSCTGTGRGADSRRGGGCESPRRSAAARRLSSATRRERDSRPRSVRHDCQCRRQCGGLARRRRRLRAGVRRRLRDDVRGACGAVSAGTGLDRSRGGRGDPGDVLHGLDQRVRARATAVGRDRALSRRLERHRHDGDSAGSRAGRDRLCHGRFRREGPRLRGAWGADARSTTGRRTSWR